MKKWHPTQSSALLALLVVVVALCADGARAQGTVGDNLLSSKAKLSTLASVSVIPIANFTNLPGLTEILSSTVEGPWVCEFLDEATVVCGYENFYAPEGDLLPGLVTYKIVGDDLVLTDIIYAPAFVGIASSAVSANPARPYAAMSYYESMIQPRNPFLPHVFSMPVYDVDVATGAFSAAPLQVINIADVDPEAWTLSIAYNGIAGMSKDGRFLVLTYGVMGVSPLPSPFPNNVNIVENRFAILELSADGASYDVRAIVPSVSAEKLGYTSFAQKAIMEAVPGDAEMYDVGIAVNSWNLLDPLGITAQVAYYQYNATSYDFVLGGQSWSPQYIQGVAMDVDKRRIWSICNGVANNGVSVDQNPRQPYDNPAVHKTANLRLDEFDRDTGALAYAGGVNLGADGIQVQPSRDSKILYTTSAPALSNDLFLTLTNPVSPIGRRYAPSITSSYSVKGNGELDLEWTTAGSPLTFAIASSPSDERLVVSGQDTFKQIGPRVVGQRGTQLYAVAKSNK